MSKSNPASPTSGSSKNASRAPRVSAETGPEKPLVIFTSDEVSGDPAVHSGHLQQILGEVIAHLREDVTRVKEPGFQVLLETSAEVLTGLKTAFAHYDGGKGKSPQR